VSGAGFMVVDPAGLAGGDIHGLTLEAAQRAVASMPASYGLYVEVDQMHASWVPSEQPDYTGGNR